MTDKPIRLKFMQIPLFVGGVVLMLVMLFPKAVYAQAPPPIDWNLIDNMIRNGVTVALSLSGLVALIVIIFGGYMWMVSAGDPGKIKQAQGAITWGIIGLVFLMILVMILQVIFRIFLP